MEGADPRRDEAGAAKNWYRFPAWGGSCGEVAAVKRANGLAEAVELNDHEFITRLFRAI